ncbi:MAG: leucyl aminopeptidase family protein [Candidatus Sumerlaeales bacterium]|nr:leucyl aminopeptidase family protein [Candidatus Sumerlaeales bacterium]
MTKLNISLLSKPVDNIDSPALAVFFKGCAEEVKADFVAPFVEQLEILLADLNSKQSRDYKVMPLGSGKVFTHIAVFNMSPDEDAKPDTLVIYDQFRTVGADAIKIAEDNKCKRVVFFLGKSEAACVASLVAEGCIIGSYRFDKYKKSGDDADAPMALAVDIIIDESELQSARESLNYTTLVANETNYARNLINESPSELNPKKYIEIIQGEVAKLANTTSQIWDKDALAREGYGGILGVGRGARSGPYLAVLRYCPPEAKSNSHVHLALVGKGITFDTGGLCLKSSKGMNNMKADMTGSAVVLAAFKAIVKLKIPCRVTALIPIAENAIGNHSYLPGDVLTMHSGKTVFIGNTDAEGRLLLADALWQASKEGATHIIDIATLTGAIAAALGPYTAGLFSNDDDDFGSLVFEAGDEVGENLWPMPLIREQREFLDHHLADLNNVGSNSGGGAITAALFLQEFVGKGIKWAHLDIAGVDTVEVPRWRYYGKGATAFGVRTLTAAARMLID